MVDSTEFEDTTQVIKSKTVQPKKMICHHDGSDLQKHFLLPVQVNVYPDSAYSDSIRTDELDMAFVSGFDYTPVGLYSVGNNEMTFYDEGTNGAIYTSEFVFEDHTYLIDSSEKYAQICKIDDRTPWGTFGNLPSIQIDSIIIKLSGRKTFLPDSAFSDLYEPIVSKHDEFSYNQLYRTDFGHMLWMLCSDGAGSYSVIFFIEDGKYIGRLIGRPF